MIRDILLTAGAVLAAAFLLGLGWWIADRRAGTRLAEVRAALTAQLDESERDCNDLANARVALSTQLAGCRRELDAMTEAHHRSAAEFERLLEAWRKVPEAFRAPLPVLEERRDILTPVEMLFDEYTVPRPDVYAAEAVRLASMLDAPTGAWKRVVYRPAPPTDADTVHEGELLDKAGVALVPARSARTKGRRR